MNSKEFNNLTLEEQRDFLNSELAKGKSLTKIDKEINISRSTFKNRMKKINHVYDSKTNQYVYTTDIVEAPKKKINKTNKTDSLMEIFTDTDLKNNLINLAMNYSKIQALIDRFENNNINEYESVIDENLRTKLINEKDTNVRTTVQVNKNIMKDFDKFCSENKEYQKQDLISAALYEFLTKRNFYNEDNEDKESSDF